MFRNSCLEDAPCTIFFMRSVIRCSLINVCLELILTACCFQLPLEHPLVDSLENIRFLTLKRIANCFQWLFHFFSFIGVLRIDQIHQNCVKSFSHSSGCVLPNSVVSPSPELLASVLPSESYHWKSHLDLFLTWRSVCFPT